MGAIPFGMIQWYFVMPDDSVVEVGNIEGTVGSDGYIDGAKPGIVAGQEVPLFVRLEARTVPDERVAMNAAGHHIADEETAALSYFVGNCITCHNDGDSINSSFSLYPEEAVGNTVDQPTESETGEGIRVVPGDPEQSVLYVTVVEAGAPGYRGPFKVMPPIGGDVIDPDASAILGSWIENL